MKRLLLVVPLLFAGQAVAQSFTWVSGVGDDANPCTRTAPCATFTRAVEAVQSGGVVSALDPGTFQVPDAGGVAGFSTLYINKSVTIHGGKQGAIADELIDPVSVQGVVIEAGPNDVVVLRDVTVSAHQSGTNGIVFKSGRALHLENVRVNGFSFDGVTFEPASPALLNVNASVFSNNGGRGLSVQGAQAVVVNSEFRRNDVGVRLGGGTSAALTGSTFAGNADAGALLGGGGSAAINVNFENATMNGNGIGVVMDSANANTVARLSDSTVYGNGARSQLRGASQLFTFGNNRLQGGTCARTANEPTSASLVAGQPYAFPGIQLTNGVGALSVVTLDGGLPPGVTLDGGALSGVPSLKGSYSFTQRLTDSFGCGTGPATWQFNVSCPTQTLAPAAPPAGTTGVAYPSTTFTLSGAVGASQVTIANPLPIGLTLNGATISGTPTEAGTFPLAVSAVDSATCGVAQSLALVIAPGAGYVPTSLRLTAPASVEYGVGFLLSASVDAGTSVATGAVDFSDDGGVIASATLTGQQASVPVTANAVGPRDYFAVYGGGGMIGGSRGAVSVTVVPASTRLSLMASSATPAVSQQVGIGAEVKSDGGVPVGAVAFFVDGADAGVYGLDGGVAGFATSFSTAGTRTVTAQFTGSTNYAPSAVGSLQLAVANASGGGSGGSGGGAVGGGSGGSTGGGSGGATGGGSGGATGGGSGGATGGGSGGSAGGGAGGTGGGSSGGGCGCNQTSALMPFAMLALLGLRRRRR